jgi:hypothetical protein
VTVVFLPIGLLADMGFNRAFSLGLYLVGAFLTVAGFFVGNRGPLRAWSGGTDPTETGLTQRGSRSLRRASREEQFEAMAVSAVFIILGLTLMALGVVVDSRVRLV